MLGRLFAWARGDVAEQSLAAERNRCVDAYELVDGLPPGPARQAAWAAYVLQTYGDKLIGASNVEGWVRPDTATLARASFRLAAGCLAAVQDGGRGVPEAPPHWHTPIRSHEQLVGMRETLEALRTYLAFELGNDGAPQLAPVDVELARVDRLWIERAPAEIRGGIGSALVRGLDAAYAVGRGLAG